MIENAVTQDDRKKEAALAAAALVTDGMTVGLGTGSTAAHLIRRLGERVRAGLDIRAIPTSQECRALAQAEGIDLIEPDETTTIDIAIDGTDEMDAERQLIKGGGGALLREKIIAHAARRFVVIADESKDVTELGAFPLPVEIDRAYWPLTIARLRRRLTDLGAGDAAITLRPAPGGQQGFYITDGGHLIADCALGRIHDPRNLEQALGIIPGVVETGLFIDCVDDAFIARAGGVEHITRA